MNIFLTKLLILEFFILSVAYAIDRNFPYALYWASAGVLNIALLWGMTK